MMAAIVKHGPTKPIPFERHVAAEDMLTGDYCRVRPDGRVRLLVSGTSDTLTEGDIAPVQDLTAGQSGMFVRVA